MMNVEEQTEVIRWSGDEIERLNAENKRLRGALHPGDQPCDCIEHCEYKGERFWAIDCQCGNHDDIGQAQAWCSKANSYEGATGQSAAVQTTGQTTEKDNWENEGGTV